MVSETSERKIGAVIAVMTGEEFSSLPDANTHHEEPQRSCCCPAGKINRRRFESTRGGCRLSIEASPERERRETDEAGKSRLCTQSSSSCHR